MWQWMKDGFTTIHRNLKDTWPSGQSVNNVMVSAFWNANGMIFIDYFQKKSSYQQRVFLLDRLKVTYHANLLNYLYTRTWQLKVARLALVTIWNTYHIFICYIHIWYIGYTDYCVINSWFVFLNLNYYMYKLFKNKNKINYFLQVEFIFLQIAQKIPLKN